MIVKCSIPSRLLLSLIFYSGSLTLCLGQTGSIHEPVRYIGGQSIDPDLHEGRLRYAMGVESRQTLRVNRTLPELADGFGWTYNHASNLAYWKGNFYQQYLSNRVDEVLVQGEVPPRRFFGRWKDFGPCYVRGIVPGNGNPPGNDMWLTYSMNKEDMWVSRVPTPIRFTETGPVKEDFEAQYEYGPVPDWNIYAPIWAPVNLVRNPGGKGISLSLKDEDPYDYARAIRVFEEAAMAQVEVDIWIGKDNEGMLEIDVVDRYGNRPVRFKINEKAELVFQSGFEEKHFGTALRGQWHQLRLHVNAEPFAHYTLFWNGKLIAEKVPLAEAVKSVERVSFRTGPYRSLPNRKTPNEDPVPPLVGADQKESPSLFFIDNLKVQTLKSP